MAHGRQGCSLQRGNAIIASWVHRREYKCSRKGIEYVMYKSSNSGYQIRVICTYGPAVHPGSPDNLSTLRSPCLRLSRDSSRNALGFQQADVPHKLSHALSLMGERSKQTFSPVHYYLLSFLVLIEVPLL